MIVLAINFLNNVYNAFKIEKVMIQLTFFIRIENELLTEQVKLRFNNYHVCDFFIKILSFYQCVFGSTTTDLLSDSSKKLKKCSLRRESQKLFL